MASNVILLVEDNPDDEALTRRAFQKNLIRNPIEVAHDGVEALDYLFGCGPHERQIPDLPVLVLLDLKLPKLNGLEVLRQLREHPRTKQVPVVMLTSSTEERDVIASYQSGVNSYVHKPVDFTEFMESVKHLGLYWLVLNVPPPKNEP